MSRSGLTTDKTPSVACFDFTSAMRRLCADIARRMSEFGHLRMECVAIRFCQARKAVGHGMQASLTPLRFAGGARVEARGGRRLTIDRLFDNEGREMLYLLSFYLPRFLDQPFSQKLVTIVHELWHIGPDFDGDVRRLPGRCHAHGPLERHYDDQMAVLAERWLALSPPQGLYRFLQSSYSDLCRTYGGVAGTAIATPRIVPAPRLAAG
jgi:hypothetical protein